MGWQQQQQKKKKRQGRRRSKLRRRGQLVTPSLSHTLPPLLPPPAPCRCCQSIFSLSGETAKLERFERRYMWFRSRLEEKKEQWAIFPEAWRVPQVCVCVGSRVGRGAGAEVRWGPGGCCL